MYNVFKSQQSKLRNFSDAFKHYGNIPTEKVKAPTKASDVKIDSQQHTVYKNVVCLRQTKHTLHFNAVDMTEEQQAMFAEHELEHIKTTIKETDIKSISFNFIHENIYRCHLNMPIRRLGFDSFFQRYNDDKGLAVFFVRDAKEVQVDNSHMGAYNRMAYARQAQGLF